MTLEHGRIRCVLFDLDGTLVDTAPDLVGALNALRLEAGLPELPLPELRHLASHGSGALLLAGFPQAKDGERKALVGKYLDAYLRRISLESRLFPQVEALLDHLEHSRIRWGIVTNKPRALTEPLLAALELTPDCVVSGDSLSRRKPDPAPVLHACERCGATPSETLYVGDAERDVQAAHGAGAHSAVALWGYLDPAEDARLWQADHYLQTPVALIELLTRQNSKQAVS